VCGGGAFYGGAYRQSLGHDDGQGGRGRAVRADEAISNLAARALIPPA
jgi:hypothetical protein